MTTVAQILKSKADQTIYTISPAASVFDAAKLRVRNSRISSNDTDFLSTPGTLVLPTI